MMSTLLWGMVSGILIGIALTVQWAEYAKRKTDESLKTRNEELTAEVVRLRAQVALHIGAERLAA